MSSVARLTLTFVAMLVSSVGRAAALHCQMLPVGAAGRPDARDMHIATVVDAIRMAKLVYPSTEPSQSSPDDVALFSPDGKRVVVLLRRGDLQKNTNDYFLLMWSTGQLFRGHNPDTLLLLASSSNRPAIEHVTWLPDNQTLIFLGERPGELHQVFSFNIQARRLSRLTNHATNVCGYSVTPDGKQVAYTAEEPPAGFFEDEKARRHGVVVATRELLPDLLFNRKRRNALGGIELFVRRGSAPARRVDFSRNIIMAAFRPWPVIAPDGKHVVVTEYVEQLPAEWHRYSASTIRASEFFYACVVADLATGRSRVLWTFLEDVVSTAVWSPDSRWLFLSGVFLPLERVEGPERQQREAKSSTVELDPESGNFRKISDETLVVVKWDAQAGQLILRKVDGNSHSVTATVIMRKRGSEWEPVAGEASDLALPRVALEQNMNTPPKLVVRDPTAHKKVLLLDPNPQLGKLRLGRVEEITLAAKDGHRVGGELYYPVNYVSGRRYPLVIQTHGSLGPSLFSMDGAFTSADAAQALAGKDIMVLQVSEEAQDDFWGYISRYWGTPQEAVLAMRVYEAAIDYLDGKGLIDRNLVGLIGFSRSCLYVKFALTHSKYPFAAAAVEDGLAGGFFEYIAFNATLFERLNGGLPFGNGLKSWLVNSPGFNINEVHTPVRIIAANNGTSLLGEWDWFASLSRLRRPVELVVLQDASHVLEKPWDRMVSQQGNADWFSFWLKNEEDADPAKAEQFTRWRALRKLQEQPQIAPDPAAAEHGSR